MKTTFIAPNGVQIEGVILYTSPVYRSSKNFTDECYDEIVYAQNRIAKIHHTLSLNDEDNFEEYRDPQIEIISEYVVIPELD